MARDRLVRREQGDDGLEALLHHRSLPQRVDAEHVGIGGELARADAEHHAAAREMVEQHHAVGEEQRVVIGERAHAGAQLDAAGALRRHRDEHLGRRDELVAGGVVLADPRLVEAELVEPLDELEIAVEGEGGVLARGVERREEDPEPERPVETVRERHTLLQEHRQSSRSGCSRTMRA